VSRERQGRVRPRQRACHVQVTRSLQRVVPGPNAGSETKPDVVDASSFSPFVQKLFAGIEVLGCYHVRVTRNSDLFVDERKAGSTSRSWRASWHTWRLWRRPCAGDPPSTARRTGAITVGESGRPTDVDMYRMPGPSNLKQYRSAIYELVKRHRISSTPSSSPGVPAAGGHSDSSPVIRQNDMLPASPLQELRAR